MIHVVEQLNTGAVHGFADHISLFRCAQEEVRIITEWFQYHDQSLWFQYFSSQSQGFYYMCGLNADREIPFKIARYNSGPFCIDAFSCFQRLTADLYKVIFEFLLAGGKGYFP